VQDDVEHKLLKLDDFCPDAGASFPPSVRVENRVSRSLNRNPCQMAFHNPAEHSPDSSRVILSRYEHNGFELMIVAPLRKRLTFCFGSIRCGDSHESVTPSDLSWRICLAARSS
jgi:hypothetical protein